jgi:cobyrinic acid a,c-diamide synthase
VVGDTPYFAPGTVLKGHEFHYSKIVAGEDLDRAVLELDRGRGCGKGRDGVVKDRVWASYLHLHALATPEWTEGVVRLADRVAKRDLSPGAAWA